MLSVECLQCNTNLSPHQGKGGELLLENVREADLTSFDCSQYSLCLLMNIFLQFCMHKNPDHFHCL